MNYTEIIWSLIFGTLSAVCRSIIIVETSYFVKYKGGSGGQFGVYCFGWGAIFLAAYVLIRKETKSKSQFIDFLKYNLLCKRNDDTIQKIIQEKSNTLLLRGTWGAFSGAIMATAMLYIDSGDFATLRNVAVIFISFIMTTYIFKIKPDWVVASIATVLCIGGLILVDQPAFIFDVSGLNSSQLSGVGLALSIITGVTRAFADYYVKKTKGIHFTLVGFVGCVFNVIAMCILLIFDYYFVGVAWKWFNDLTATLVFYLTVPFNMVLFMIFNTLAFQKGQMFMLSIIITVIEVVLCYLLDYLFFGQAGNMLTYIGCAIICISAIPINWQAYKMKQIATHSVKEENPQDNNQSNGEGYESIPTKEPSKEGEEKTGVEKDVPLLELKVTTMNVSQLIVLSNVGSIYKKMVQVKQ